MTFSLIEDRGDVKVSYDSILVHPKKMNIFNSDLSLKIINELVKEPCCAMDLARKLGQHEQKIYYHIRKMEDAGVIRMSRIEKRYGMNAKIYTVVSPVISTKIYDDGHEVESCAGVQVKNNIAIEKFLYPFVKNRKMNAKIIVGDPYPHGKYEKGAMSTVHTIDFIFLLGNLVDTLNYPHYRLDVDTRKDDLKDNLIIFSSPKGNTIADIMNPSLPIRFNPDKGWCITSDFTGKKYEESRCGVILKCDNPFDKKKKILWISGIRTRGMQSAVIAITKYTNELMSRMDKDGNIACVVEGLDKDGDKIIDSVRFLE
jgi:DNA-binding transcriptional ArsR family regulator